MEPRAYELIDGGEGNPYHFLFYMIANFSVVDVSQPITYYYPNKKDCKVSEEFLALLPPNFTRHLTKDPAIHYGTHDHGIPIFPDFSLPLIYQFIRQLYAAHLSPVQKKGKRIYIQRVPPQTRTFTNEPQLQAMLENAGYETVVLENYPVKEQIRIVSEAEYIIGAHGAGLAFTVFCHPGTKLIEIDGRNNTVKKHYYHMAISLGNRFFRFQHVSEDYEVDTAVLQEFFLEWHNEYFYN
jgi:hypothetical protein